jgi:type III secretory pathway component EscU
MLLNARSIAVGTSVLCFFIVGFIAWATDLSPFTGCKRAMAAVVVTYITTSLAVGIFNAILTSAMINSHIKHHKEKTGGGTD